MASIDDYVQAPPLLTADEAQLVLRVGRSFIYEAANRYLATDGEDGIPCIRVGRQIRFPRHALERLIGGPIPWPLVATDAPTPADPPTDRTESSDESPADDVDRPDDPPSLFAV